VPLDRSSTQQQSAFIHHQIAQHRTVLKDSDQWLSRRFPVSHTGNFEGSHSTDKHQHIWHTDYALTFIKVLAYGNN
jgi:hypothetical protein